MAKYKVTAPAAGYAGNVGKVQFTAGVAEIDEDAQPAELNYCKNAGYLVEPLDAPDPEPEPEQVAAEAPKRGRTRAAAKQESKSDEGAAAPKQEEDQ